MFKSSIVSNIQSECYDVLDSIGDQVAPVIVILPGSASVTGLPSSASNVVHQTTNCLVDAPIEAVDDVELTQVKSLQKSSYENASFVVTEVPEGSFLVVPPLHLTDHQTDQWPVNDQQTDQWPVNDQQTDQWPVNDQQSLQFQTQQVFPSAKIEIPRLPQSGTSSNSKISRKKKEKDSSSMFNCTKCPAVFKQKATFTLHLRRHSGHAGEKPYVCNICDKTFAQQSTLDSHKRVHTGEKPFSCSVCSAAFRQRGNLTVHMLQHSGERPYSCDHCDKTFLRRANMRLHLRMHTGDRPFKCSHCSAAFIASSALIKHESTHNTAKKIKKKKEEEKRPTPKPAGAPRRFPCPVCPKRFRQKVHRSVHLRTHTGELPYHCSKCDYRAAQQALLVVHRATHTDQGSSRDGPLQCSTCNYRCRSMAVLQRHQLRQHRCNSASTCGSPQARLLMQRVAQLQQQAEQLQQQAKECRARAAQAESRSKELRDRGERMEEEAKQRRELGGETEGPSLQMQGAGPSIGMQVAEPSLQMQVAGPSLQMQVAGPSLQMQVAGPSLQMQGAGYET